jgi:hypothetical protein
MRRVEKRKIILEGGGVHICISKTRLKASYVEEEQEIKDCPSFDAIISFLPFFIFLESILHA